MRWYLILIPFIAVFLYSGYKWQVYNEQISSQDSVALNSLYSATDIAKVRNYETQIIDEKMVYDYLRFFVFENPDDFDSTIELSLQSNNPFAINTKVTSHLGDTNPTINKTYILDSTE